MAARNRLIDFLARLVDDGEITESQAQDLLEAFDRGELGKVNLPLAPTEFVRGLEDDDSTDEWLAALLLLLGIQSIQLPISQRIKGVDDIQDNFNADAKRHAEQLANGNLTVGQWQRKLFDSYRRHMVQQALLAAASEDLTEEQRKRIDEKIRTDAAYMSRFADVLALQAMVDAELSAAYIENRSIAYSGTGRGEFFESLSGAILLLAGGGGWVEQYIAVDDRKTCPACIDAGNLRHGGLAYYLPGQGPMPGIICYGRGRCRCRRVPVYDPAIYARLVGI